LAINKCGAIKIRQPIRPTATAYEIVRLYVIGHMHRLRFRCTINIQWMPVIPKKYKKGTVRVPAFSRYDLFQKMVIWLSPGIPSKYP
jgi:cytochrome b subunit of formate dehydrogenase